MLVPSSPAARRRQTANIAPVEAPIVMTGTQQTAQAMLTISRFATTVMNRLNGLSASNMCGPFLKRG